jgi:predicted DNA-binding transcriptional regulator AlpA
MEREKLLKETEVAEMANMSTFTLRNQRHQGRGPAYIKYGRSVRYRLSDVQKYFDSRRIAPEEK